MIDDRAFVLNAFLQIDPLPIVERFWQRGVTELNRDDLLLETQGEGYFPRSVL
jgi:hypothetical protein